MEGWQQAVLYGTCKRPKRDRGSGSRVGSVFAFLGALAIATGVALALYSWLFGDDGPPELKLDVPQTATATDANAHIAIDAAAFGATATYVRIVVQPSRHDVVAVRFLEGAVERSNFDGESGMAPLQLLPGVPRVWRIGGMAVLSPTLTITKLELSLADGSTVTINGNWRMVLALPQDIERRMRVEDFSGGPITSEGVTLTAVNVRRSNNGNSRQPAD
jgi:hypothetical protein